LASYAFHVRHQSCNSLRLWIRQPAQHKSIHHTEHRRVDPDPQRQRDNNRHRKPRRLPQLPQRKPEIVQHPPPSQNPVISPAIVNPFHSSPKLLNLQFPSALKNPHPVHSRKPPSTTGQPLDSTWRLDGPKREKPHSIPTDFFPNYACQF